MISSYYTGFMEYWTIRLSSWFIRECSDSVRTIEWWMNGYKNPLWTECEDD